MKRTINLRIFGLFTFIVLSSGLAWPVNKIGLAYMSPLWFTTLRIVIATVSMGLIVASLKKLRLPHWSDLPLIAVVGIIQISLYILLTNIGLAHLPAGRSSLLAYTTPLWVLPVATIIFKEHTNWLKWIGFTLGIIGLFILMSPWDLNWHNPNTIYGSFMLILAAICWAASMLCVRYMHWRKSPLELIPWQLFAGLIPVLIYTLIKEPHFHTTWNVPLVLSLIYTGFFVTGVTYFFGVIINKELPTSILSLGYLAVPVFSLFISATFMNETINFVTGVAMSLIMLGLVCVAV